MTIIWLLYQILLRQILVQLLVSIAKIADFPPSQIFNKPPPVRPCFWPQIQIDGGFEITIDGAFSPGTKLGCHEKWVTRYSNSYESVLLSFKDWSKKYAFYQN